MAQPLRIDQLDAGSTLSSSADVAVVQSGATVRTTPAAFITEAASYTASGTGATARTVQGVLRQFKSVLDFIPESLYAGIVAGTNTTDLSSYIQAAITAVIGTGGWLFFPDGTYRIESALTIGATSGWRITGWSRGGAIIKQHTSNTGIFTLTACDTHSWNISDLTLTWNSAQTSSNTNSIAVYMSAASGSPGNGYYQFQIERCTITNGFRGINGNDSANGLAVWGYALRDLIFSGMSGAWIKAVPTPSVGCPRVEVKNIYGSAAGSTEKVIYLDSVQVLKVENIEVANLTISSGATSSPVFFSTCALVQIDGLRAEVVSITVDTGQIFNLSNCTGSVRGVQATGVTMTSAITGYGLKIGSGSSITVDAGNATATLSGGAVFYTFGGSTFLSLRSLSHTGATASIDPSALVKYVDALDITSADNGNSAATLLVNSDEKTQIWATPITADRAVTLSTTGAVAGHRFRIVRTAAATGAFNLNVGTGPLKAMGTAGSFVDVEYNGSAWFLAAYGTL